MLLTLRQQRLEAVHQMAMIQRQISEKDEQLLKLRIEIAHGVAPMSVQTLAAALPGERSRLAAIGVDQPLPRGDVPAGLPAIAEDGRSEPATRGRTRVATEDPSTTPTPSRTASRD